MNANNLSRRLLTLIIASIPVTTGAEPSTNAAKHWLEQMLQATQTLSYEGTFVYVRGPHLETMRIVSGVGNQGPQQQLISLSGPQREVFAANQHVICRLAREQSTFSHQGNSPDVPFPLFSAADIGRLESYYAFEVLGPDRVAGLETRVIAIKPRDNWRLGYRLWLDERNGMMLRSALMDEKNFPIEQVIFTDLQIKKQVDFSQTPSPTEAVTDTPQGVPMTQSLWQIDKVPVGFSQVAHHQFTKVAHRNPTEQFVFADGLASVSVFLEKLDGAPPLLQGASRLGSMSVFGVARNDHQVLVIGEVPAATVESIATAIQRKSETMAIPHK